MKMMDILALQKALGGLLLFKKGLFLRTYNESTYILTQLLHEDLKVNCYKVKYLNNRVVIESAFPYSSLNKRLPIAVETTFGAMVLGDYDLSGYKLWYARRWRESNEVRTTPKDAERPL